MIYLIYAPGNKPYINKCWTKSMALRDVTGWNGLTHFDLMTLWASYQIRKTASCACAGNAGNVFPRGRIQRRPLVSDPGMYHGTCVTHVPLCISESIASGGGENVPGIPGACATRNFMYLARGPWRHRSGSTLVQIGLTAPSHYPNTLQWRHNGRDSVSNHQPHDYLFGRRSKKISKLRVTGLCAGNSPGTGESPAQMASNTENVSIWWRHHELLTNHQWGIVRYITERLKIPSLDELTRWGRMTHICVSELTIIGSNNGLAPGRREVIFWTNAGIFLNEPLGTNFSENFIQIQIFSVKKMHSNMSQPQCVNFTLTESKW